MLYYTNISHILKEIARIQRRKCLYTHLILCVLSGGVCQLSGGVSQLSGGVSLCVLSGGVSLRVHRKGGRDRYCVGNSIRAYCVGVSVCMHVCGCCLYVHVPKNTHRDSHTQRHIQRLYRGTHGE